MKRLLRDVLSLHDRPSSLLSTAAVAQLSTAQLSGRITDESGAMLPGVTVTATQTNTGFIRTSVTDGQRGMHPVEPPDRARIDSRCRCRVSAPTCRRASSCRSAASPVVNVVLTVGSLEEIGDRRRAPRRWWT
mgnify:CR=1 FL=1